MRRLRLKRKLTQRQLADRAGIAASHLGLIETGRIQQPSVSVAIRLAAALQVSVPELFGEIEIAS